MIRTCATLLCWACCWWLHRPNLPFNLFPISYGDDPNDFLVKRWEKLILEDIYIAIYKTDGIQSARLLKTSIDERIRHGNALDNYNEDISSSSFWSNSARISSLSQRGVRLD